MQIRIHNGTRLNYLDLMYLDVDLIPKGNTFFLVLKFKHFKEEKPTFLDRLFGYGYREYCTGVTCNHKMKVITEIRLELLGHDYTEISQKLEDVCLTVQQATGRSRNKRIPTKSIIDAINNNMTKIKTHAWSIVRH